MTMNMNTQMTIDVYAPDDMNESDPDPRHVETGTLSMMPAMIRNVNDVVGMRGDSFMWQLMDRDDETATYNVFRNGRHIATTNVYPTPN